MNLGLSLGGDIFMVGEGSTWIDLMGMGRDLLGGLLLAGVIRVGIQIKLALRARRVVMLRWGLEWSF